MLGTLRMDLDTCIKEYLDMAPQIFPVENTFGRSTVGRIIKLARGKERFDPQPLESAVKRLVKEYLGDTTIAGENTHFRFRASDVNDQDDCKV